MKSVVFEESWNIYFEVEAEYGTSSLHTLLLFSFPLHLLFLIINNQNPRSHHSFQIIPPNQHSSPQPRLLFSHHFPYRLRFFNPKPQISDSPLHTKPLLLLTLQGSDPSLPSILLNSHLDSVPAEPSKWSHPPFSAHHSPDGKIFARGAQDDKCIGIQYLEAIKNLVGHKDGIFTPLRTVHVSFVPDEEVGGFDGMAKFVESNEFKELNVGFVLDEGQASPSEAYRVFYADRSPWHVVIKAAGEPGHGSRLYDNSALENLMKSVELITKFRETQFDMVKAGLAANSEVISVNPVYFKAGLASNEGFVMNMQPSEAEAGFDVRMPPTSDAELLRRKISEEWAPAWRNMSYQITEKGPLRDYMGKPLLTQPDESNPWWPVLKQAIEAAGGKLNAKPEILASTTDARFMRQMGIPTFGFSPMKNTPILLHDHDEFLVDTIFMEGIKVYESIIKSLSSFTRA